MGCRELQITDYFQLSASTTVNSTESEKTCAHKKPPRGFNPIVSVSISNYRYYSPELGRWLSRDPIRELGGVNLYGMVGNEPVKRWDYLGLAECRLSDDKGWLDITGAFFEGMWKGTQGIAVALTGGFFSPRNSILGEEWLGLIDISDSHVNMGIWGGRVSMAALAAIPFAAMYTGTTVTYSSNLTNVLGFNIQGQNIIYQNMANIAAQARLMGIPIGLMKLINFHHESFHRGMGILGGALNSEKLAEAFGNIAGTLHWLLGG